MSSISRRRSDETERVEELFDRMAATYAADEPALREFLDACLPDDAVRGKTALELGCGTGTTCCLLVEKGARLVVGVDISRVSLAVAERQRRAGDGAAIAFVRAMAPPLPFAAGAFDVVFSKGTFAYIPDASNALDDTLRVTRDGGLLVHEFVRRHRVAGRQLARLLEPNQLRDGDKTPDGEDDVERRRIGMALDYYGATQGRK